MSELIRPEFEKWAITNAFLGLSEACMERHLDGYLGCELHAAWLAWQASRQYLVIELPVISVSMFATSRDAKAAKEGVDMTLERIHTVGVKTK